MPSRLQRWHNATAPPETGTTNVARIFEVAVKSDDQLVFYDPGVGTMGARVAITPLARRLTQIAGLVVGYGIKDNIEEAYGFLADHWQPGDRIYLFGFSRGAYTARALSGMLRTVGLLRPGAGNLTPYALKLYAKKGDVKPSEAEEQKFWRVRREFANQFGNPAFPNPFDKSRHQVHFLGVWDTVKSVGWLNWKARFEQARWPFTAKISNVATARHAMAIDERRRPFPVYRFDPDLVAASAGRLQEVWFAGVHSDVGGQFEEHKLSDLAFDWMVREAETAGLVVEAKAYKRLLGVSFDAALPADLALGEIHRNPGTWALAWGWKKRGILPGDTLHPSAQRRVEATRGTATAYAPRLH
ncbi:MAG: DUF2235 domain-containing protein [Trebonia sp.]